MPNSSHKISASAVSNMMFKFHQKTVRCTKNQGETAQWQGTKQTLSFKPDLGTIKMLELARQGI